MIKHGEESLLLLLLLQLLLLLNSNSRRGYTAAADVSPIHSITTILIPSSSSNSSSSNSSSSRRFLCPARCHRLCLMFMEAPTGLLRGGPLYHGAPGGGGGAPLPLSLLLLPTGLSPSGHPGPHRKGRAGALGGPPSLLLHLSLRCPLLLFPPLISLFLMLQFYRGPFIASAAGPHQRGTLLLLLTGLQQQQQRQRHSSSC